MSYAIYLREKIQNISVQEQQNELVSALQIPENQLEVYYDTDLSDRSGFNMLKMKIQENPMDMLVVYNLRSLELTLKELAAFLSDLSRNDIQFVCMRPYIDTTSKDWSNTYAFLEELVIMQNEAARQRLIKSIKERKAKGEHVGRTKGSIDINTRKRDGYFKEAKQAKKNNEFIKRFMEDIDSLDQEDI